MSMIKAIGKLLRPLKKSTLDILLRLYNCDPIPLKLENNELLIHMT